MALKPVSVHTRQLGALAHDRSSVARRSTCSLHARFTCAKHPFVKPLSDELKGMYADRLVSSMSK